MAEWKFRLAEPKDAENFSRWAAQNAQIDSDDLLAGMKSNNPTVVFFVAEKDGDAVSFVPVFLTAMIAHLGFNPEASASERLKALDVLKDGLSAFYVQFGLRKIQTLTKPEYRLGEWAEAHGFERDPRELYTLDLNKILSEGNATVGSSARDERTN